MLVKAFSTTKQIVLFHELFFLGSRKPWLGHVNDVYFIHMYGLQARIPSIVEDKKRRNKLTIYSKFYSLPFPVLSSSLAELLLPKAVLRLRASVLNSSIQAFRTNKYIHTDFSFAYDISDLTVTISRN